MATLVLDNKLYQGYATIAEQNNISVTDAMAGKRPKTDLVI